MDVRRGILGLRALFNLPARPRTSAPPPPPATDPPPASGPKPEDHVAPRDTCMWNSFETALDASLRSEVEPAPSRPQPSPPSDLEMPPSIEHLSKEMTGVSGTSRTGVPIEGLPLLPPDPPPGWFREAPRSKEPDPPPHRPAPRNADAQEPKEKKRDLVKTAGQVGNRSEPGLSVSNHPLVVASDAAKSPSVSELSFGSTSPSRQSEHRAPLRLQEASITKSSDNVPRSCTPSTSTAPLRFLATSVATTDPATPITTLAPHASSVTVTPTGVPASPADDPSVQRVELMLTAFGKACEAVQVRQTREVLHVALTAQQEHLALLMQSLADQRHEYGDQLERAVRRLSDELSSDSVTEIGELFHRSAGEITGALRRTERLSGSLIEKQNQILGALGTIGDTTSQLLAVMRELGSGLGSVHTPPPRASERHRQVVTRRPDVLESLDEDEPEFDA